MKLLSEISKVSLDEFRSIVSLIFFGAITFGGHSTVNILFNTPNSFLFAYVTLPLAVIIPSVVLNLLYFKKYLHRSKISAQSRIGLGLWLSLIIIMNIIPFSLLLLIELPYHSLWSVDHGYYQGKHSFDLLELVVLLPVNFYNFHLWRKRVQKEWMKLYQAKIPIFTSSKSALTR